MQSFLGIDVSKGYADFLLLDQSKNILEEAFQLDDNNEGRKQLKQLVLQWFDNGITELQCGVESTGGYENNWYSFLRGLTREHNLKVARLNAKAVKAVGDATLKRTVTDAVSAENIAVFMMSFPEKVNYEDPDSPEASGVYSEGRTHMGYIRMLQKQKVQLSNQLEKLLYQHFPEMLIYCRHGMPGWLLMILSRYSSAVALVKAGDKKLVAVKGVSVAKACALVKKAEQSQQVVSKHIEHVIAVTCKEILHKQQLIESEKAYLADLYEHNEQVQLINSIRCIGKDSSIALALEIQDIGRFETVEKLTSYFGVHPSFKQSGDGKWASHMSKKGRGELRAVLYMTAMTGIRHNHILKQIYARFRAKGMKHYQAMGVVMHKLLRIIYGVLKNNRPYDPAIDEKNTTEAKQKKEQKEQEAAEKKSIVQQKIYRFQGQSIEAPISRRAAEKRKKQAASQAS